MVAAMTGEAADSRQLTPLSILRRVEELSHQVRNPKTPLTEFELDLLLVHFPALLTEYLALREQGTLPPAAPAPSDPVLPAQPPGDRTLAVIEGGAQ